jgi:hypothetical protein
VIVRACPPFLGLVALAALLGGLACAGAGGGSRSGNPNLITAEEIDQAGASTAYEVIDRLRPRWLRVRLDRSATRETEIVVFVDNLQMSGLNALWDIDARTLHTIRWLDSAQAGTLPGMGSRHVEGAIVIETR